MHGLRTDLGSGAAFYEALRGELRALLADERDLVANASQAAALIWHALPDLNWAGFYFFDGTELVVPIVAGGALRGVFDMDSPTPARFDEADRIGVERLVAAFVAATAWR